MLACSSERENIARRLLCPDRLRHLVPEQDVPRPIFPLENGRADWPDTLPQAGRPGAHGPWGQTDAIALKFEIQSARPASSSCAVGTPPQTEAFQFSLEWIEHGGINEIWLPLVIGSLICATVSSVAGYCVILWIWRWRAIEKWKLRRRRQKRKETSASTQG